VTHDQIEAMTMADRIGVMSEGVLVQLGTPREIYERPNSAYVAGRLARRSSTSFLLSFWAIHCRRWYETVGLRTEHIRISPGMVRDHALRCTGSSISRSGSRPPQASDPSLVTLADPSQPLRAGDQVSLEFVNALFRSGW